MVGDTLGNIDLLDDLFDLPDDAPAMNEALAAWAREHQIDGATDDVRKAVRGPCSLCREHATTRCLRCERPVCTRHHHVMVGICTKCTDAAADEVDAAERDASSPQDPFADERPSPRPELDLDWIE